MSTTRATYVKDYRTGETVVVRDCTPGFMTFMVQAVIDAQRADRKEG